MGFVIQMVPGKAEGGSRTGRLESSDNAAGGHLGAKTAVVIRGPRPSDVADQAVNVPISLAERACSMPSTAAPASPAYSPSTLLASTRFRVASGSARW